MGWEKLGDKMVNGRRDRDSISVSKNEDYRAIRCKVERAPVEFRSLVVHYRNGEQQKIPCAQTVRAGGSTRDYDLKGKDRKIKEVEMTYNDKAFKDEDALVELWGRD